MKFIYSLVVMGLLSHYVLAQTTEKKEEKKEIPEARVFTATQNATIGGKNITLDTEAGTLQLRNIKDEPIALFGYTYYAKKGEDVGKRPIVFAYNGGPLSASFWLHMGILGPKRVVINDPDFTKGAPYEIVNNEYSILDVADLVMIDPVGVGLSHPIGEAEFKDFWSVDGDIESIGLFIEQFLIAKGRMNAPKFLLGESYGTYRNAGLMKHLQDKGIALNGVIMVSAVFDLPYILFAPGDDRSYLMHFPTYAATAWYHNKVANKPANLEDFLKEVRTFTEEVYAPALLKGDRLTESEKSQIASQLAARSGLSQEYWLRADLRVKAREFFQEFMRKENRIVGRFDGRFTGHSQDLLNQNADYDPQSKAISAPYITAFKHYLYNDLKVVMQLTYVTSTSQREKFSSDWSHAGNMIFYTQATTSTAQDMATAMIQNPNLKVLILNGYYDLATVFYGVEYSISHLGLPADLRKNILMEYYEAGHMMYTHPPSMEKFKKDVAGFIEELTK
ncbi:MAG: S10 family peptidase [Thermonemataceae bacterium]